MTTEEHLEKILAFCRSRLALAEKRTPGLWNTQARSYQVQTNEGGVGMYVAEMMTRTSYERDSDAAFIAACAGAAEAGWRATILAIGRLRQIADMAKAHAEFAGFATWAEQGLENILAAYPLELLTDDLT